MLNPYILSSISSKTQWSHLRQSIRFPFIMIDRSIIILRHTLATNIRQIWRNFCSVVRHIKILRSLLAPSFTSNLPIIGFKPPFSPWLRAFPNAVLWQSLSMVLNLTVALDYGVSQGSLYLRLFS